MVTVNFSHNKRQIHPKSTKICRFAGGEGYVQSICNTSNTSKFLDLYGLKSKCLWGKNKLKEMYPFGQGGCLFSMLQEDF